MSVHQFPGDPNLFPALSTPAAILSKLGPNRWGGRGNESTHRHIYVLGCLVGQQCRWPTL